MVGNPPIRPKLISFFSANPNRQILVYEIMEATGEDSPARVYGGMQNLIRSGQLPGLRRITRGGPWIYEPDAKHKPTQRTSDSIIMEVIATSASGHLFLKGTDGNFYKAQKL